MKSIVDLRKIAIMFLCLTLIIGSALSMNTKSVEAAGGVQEVIKESEELTFAYDEGYKEDIAIINPSFGKDSPFEFFGAAIDEMVLPKRSSKNYIRMMSGGNDIGNINPHSALSYGPDSSVLTATVGTAPNRQFIIQFTNMANSNGDPAATYQVILHEASNDIDFQYVRLTGFGMDDAYGSYSKVSINELDGEVILLLPSEISSLTEKSASRFKSDGDGSYILEKTLAYNPIMLVAAGKLAPAVQVAPSNGQTVGNNVRLSWEAVQHAENYSVLLTTEIIPNFSDEVAYSINAGTTPNVVAKNLDPNTTYYWKVVAYMDDYNTVSYSNTSSFTTLDEITTEAATPLNQQAEEVLSGTNVKFDASYGGIVSDQDFDDQPNALPLGFEFKFNGKTYTEIFANTSGLLMFEDIQRDTNLVDKTLPFPYVPGEYDNGTKVDHFITAYHAPLNVYGDNKVSYVTIGKAPNRQFIIQYTNAYDSKRDVGTFQVILNEGSNDIQFQYPHILEGFTGGEALVAVQEKPMKGQAAKFAIYSQQQAKLSEKLAVKFVTSGNGYSVAPDATYLPVLIMSADFAPVPVFTLPADGGVGSTLTWEGDADKYVLLISQDASFASREWINVEGNTYTVNDLIPNKVYYAKVIAYKDYNQTYSNTIRFASSLSTDAAISTKVNNVGATNVNLSANIVTEQAMTATGFVYGTSTDLIYNDNNVVVNHVKGAMTTDITGLQTGTTYYAKGYVATAEGIYYSNTVTFTPVAPVVVPPVTPPVVPTPTPVVPTPTPTPTPEPTKPPVTDIVLNDVAGHWAADNIKKAVSDGFVNGYPDGGFHPNSAVTRAEFVTMLMRALKADDDGTTLNFTDNSSISKWAQQAISQAVGLGYLGGYPDGSFRPNDLLTRAEMAVIVAKVLELTGTASSTSFADDATIPAWAKNSIFSLQEKGLVSGKPGNKYDPNATTTRAEAITLILNMMNKQ